MRFPKALRITRSFHTVQHIKICMLILYLIQQSINQSNFIYKVLNPIQRHLEAYLAAFGALKWTASSLKMTIIQPFFVSCGYLKPLRLAQLLNGWAVLGLEEQKLGRGNLRKTYLRDRPSPPPLPCLQSFPHRSVPPPRALSLASTVARCVSVYLESIVGVDAAPAALLQLHLWVKIFLVLLHDVREVGPPAALCVILLTVAVVVRVVVLERRRQKKKNRFVSWKHIIS